MLCARSFAVLLVFSLASRVRAADPAEIEFFESKIRPVLVEHCYACHNSAKTAKGGLALDDRAATPQRRDGRGHRGRGQTGEEQTDRGVEARTRRQGHAEERAEAR